MCNENKNFHNGEITGKPTFQYFNIYKPMQDQCLGCMCNENKNFHYERSQVNKYFNIYKPMQD